MVKIFCAWRRKRQDNKKSQKVLYFPYLRGGKALTGPIRPKSCMVGDVHESRRIHVCQVSNWNFHGLLFYSGSNFRFYYWFLHGPYNCDTRWIELFEDCFVQEEYGQDDVNAADAGRTGCVHLFVPGGQMLQLRRMWWTQGGVYWRSLRQSNRQSWWCVYGF